MKWIKCSDEMPENSGDPIIFRKNWSYGSAKALVPISVSAIMGIFNSELKYIEWLDETNDSDLESAFNAAREHLEAGALKFFENGGEIVAREYPQPLKYKDYADYHSQLLNNQPTKQ